jgi:hypothetical protein
MMQTIRQSNIQIMGYIATSVGLLGLLLYYCERFLLGYPSNLGIVLGNAEITLVGTFGWMVSKCLLDIEKRLDRIEPNEV